MSAGAERVDVLAVLDEAIPAWEIGCDNNRLSDMREARAAVAELIEDAHLLACALAGAYAAMEMEPPPAVAPLLEQHLGGKGDALAMAGGAK